MNSEPTDGQKEIIKTAALLRGTIITSFAQVEFVLADFAVKCERFPEYKLLIKKFPYRLEDRIKAVQALIAAPGPLAAYREEIQLLINRILKFEEMRHFLAHGCLIVKVSGEGHLLEYRMYRPVKGGRLELGFLETNVDQLSYAAKEIASYAQSIMLPFRKMYLEQKIESN